MPTEGAVIHEVNTEALGSVPETKAILETQEFLGTQVRKALLTPDYYLSIMDKKRDLNMGIVVKLSNEGFHLTDESPLDDKTITYVDLGNEDSAKDKHHDFKSLLDFAELHGVHTATFLTAFARRDDGLPDIGGEQTHYFIDKNGGYIKVVGTPQQNNYSVEEVTDDDKDFVNNAYMRFKEIAEHAETGLSTQVRHWVKNIRSKLRNPTR